MPPFAPCRFRTTTCHCREKKTRTQHRPAASNLLPVEPKRYPLQGRMLTGESYVTCAPWRTIDYPCDVIGLHKEILDFYEYIKPRPSEIRMRADLVDRVKRVVLQQYPEATVEVFGSYRTGLYLPTSDIDICVYDKTTVPIIKFIDGLTEVKVDISFNTELGPRSFLTQRQLNEVYFGGIILVQPVSSLCQLLSAPSTEPGFRQDNPPLKSSSLLSSIIKVYTEVHEYRSWVESKWSFGG
eukprot:Em0008g1249a